MVPQQWEVQVGQNLSHRNPVSVDQQVLLAPHHLEQQQDQQQEQQAVHLARPPLLHRLRHHHPLPLRRQEQQQVQPVQQPAILQPAMPQLRHPPHLELWFLPSQLEQQQVRLNQGHVKVLL